VLIGQVTILRACETMGLFGMSDRNNPLTRGAGHTLPSALNAGAVGLLRADEVIE
jgi:hypothetical protein